MPSLYPRHDSHDSMAADFTLHSDTSSSSSSSHAGMDMSSSDSTMSMSMASMTFHTSISDALYSTAWTPKTQGQYAGTIIFLIFLALFYRFLVAYRSVLEHRWSKLDSERKVLVAVSSSQSQDSGIGNPKENVVVAEKNEKGLWAAKPWRWSVDLPRSGLAVLVSGVGYLLWVFRIYPCLLPACCETRLTLVECWR